MLCIFTACSECTRRGPTCQNIHVLISTSWRLPPFPMPSLDRLSTSWRSLPHSRALAGQTDCSLSAHIGPQASIAKPDHHGFVH
jgi:hypothetical protein